MRRVADTLPTLRESARTAEPAAQAALPPPLPGPPPGEDAARSAPPPDAFDPAAVVRALAARNTAAKAFGPQQTTLRDLRAALSQDAEPGNAAARARARLAAIAANNRGDRPAARTAEPSPAAAAPDASSPDPLPSPQPAPTAIPTLDEPSHDNGAEGRIAEAVAKARREAEQERERAVEAARAEEREAAEARLSQARAAWAAEEAEALSTRLDESFERLHQQLSDAFGKALAPIVDAAVRERAVRRFASVLDDLVGPDASGPAVVVKGPTDLVQALKDRMGERPTVAFETAETAELSVALDDTRVETTIGGWADDLAKVMGQSNVG